MRPESAAGVNIKNCINAGYTQHVALLFSGSITGTPFEVIGDERVAVENGFTLHEYVNQDTNLTPGSICSASFESTLLNSDGALIGFNYERDFMLMIGVEAGNKEILASASVIRDCSERLKLNNIWIGIKQGSLSFVYSNSQSSSASTYYRHMFAVENTTDANNPVYFLYIVSDRGSYKSIDEIYRITSGSGEPSQVTRVATADRQLSEYAYNRLEALAAAGTCEVWTFNGPTTMCKKFSVVNNTNTDRRTILYEHMCMLVGQQPRKTLGKIVTFSALGTSSKLDKNADDYANTVWTSSRTLNTIRRNILDAAGLNNYYSLPGGSGSQSFSANPFMGMKGYTYRELLAYIGECVGRSLCECRRYVSLTITDDIPASITLDSRFDFSANFGYGGGGCDFTRDQYYDYDAEEYSSAPVNVIISKQTEEDIGTSYPDSPSGTNTLYYLNNPLLIADDVSVIKSRLSYAWTNLYKTAYHPAVIDMPSRLIIEPGDRIKLTLEDNTTVYVPVFCVTTVWNGGADCTIECTGDKLRDQYTQKDFRQTIKEGAKIHEVIVDIEQSYSRIMDTLTQDYSTTQQTSNMISLYVGNNAYTKVSGITITTDGVNITGSKYIQLSSAGAVKCGDNWSFESDGLVYRNSDSDNSYKMYMGETKASYDSDVYAAVTTKYNTSATPGTNEKDVIGEIELYLRTILGLRGSTYADIFDTRLKFKTTNIGYPSLYAVWSDSLASSMGNGNLGTSVYPWGHGYFKNIHYNTLTQESSIDAKHDIQPLPDVGDLIDKLTPVSYVYNGDETFHKRFGLIHEQTVDIIPEICVGDKCSDAKDKAINYMDLVSILLKEIQSLRNRVKELESKNGQN